LRLNYWGSECRSRGSHILRTSETFRAGETPRLSDSTRWEKERKRAIAQPHGSETPAVPEEYLSLVADSSLCSKARAINTVSHLSIGSAHGTAIPRSSSSQWPSVGTSRKSSRACREGRTRSAKQERCCISIRTLPSTRRVSDEEQDACRPAAANAQQPAQQPGTKVKMCGPTPGCHDRCAKLGWTTAECARWCSRQPRPCRNQ
jgi:hypothetical protein